MSNNNNKNKMKRQTVITRHKASSAIGYPLMRYCSSQARITLSSWLCTRRDNDNNKYRAATTRSHNNNTSKLIVTTTTTRQHTIHTIFIVVVLLNCAGKTCGNFFEDLQLLASDVRPLSDDCPNVDLVNSLENRIALLERYVIMMAQDVKKTQERLAEREKCDCSISCHWNGTKYADQTSWQNGCETCKCQAGKVTCLPASCPVLCDDAVIVPGKCCPICPKRCKYNGTAYSHGKGVYSSPDRICKCTDGHIQCEKRPAPPSIRMTLLDSASLNDNKSKNINVDNSNSSDSLLRIMEVVKSTTTSHHRNEPVASDSSGTNSNIDSTSSDNNHQIMKQPSPSPLPADTRQPNREQRSASNSDGHENVDTSESHGITRQPPSRVEAIPISLKLPKLPSR